MVHFCIASMKAPQQQGEQRVGLCEWRHGIDRITPRSADYGMSHRRTLIEAIATNQQLAHGTCNSLDNAPVAALPIPCSILHTHIHTTRAGKEPDFKTFLLFNPLLTNGGLFLHYYSKDLMLKVGFTMKCFLQIKFAMIAL